MKTFLSTLLLFISTLSFSQSIRHDLKFNGGSVLAVGNHFQYSPQFALNPGLIAEIGYGLNINNWRYGLTYSLTVSEIKEASSWNNSVMRNQTGKVNLQTVGIEVSYHIPTLPEQLLTEIGVAAGGFRHYIPGYERFYTVSGIRPLLHFDDSDTGIFFGGHLGLKLAVGQSAEQARTHYLTLRGSYRMMPTKYQKRVLDQNEVRTGVSNMNYQFFLIQAGIQVQL